VASPQHEEKDLEMEFLGMFKVPVTVLWLINSSEAQARDFGLLGTMPASSV
jgi:hypothetical protein